MTPTKQLQQAVTDEVPRRRRQHAAAELRRAARGCSLMGVRCIAPI